MSTSSLRAALTVDMADSESEARANNSTAGLGRLLIIILFYYILAKLTLNFNKTTSMLKNSSYTSNQFYFHISSPVLEVTSDVSERLTSLQRSEINYQ